MSTKKCDNQNRWRSITVGFRMSREESDLLNHLVALSGLTKQDYIIARLLERDVVVVGNPRVYKALKDHMLMIYQELRKIRDAGELTTEFCDLLQFMSMIFVQMSQEGSRCLNV